MRNTVLRQPIGVVAAFSPWNFPMSSPGRKVAGALSSGCSIILKASEETPAGAYNLVRAFADAGLPAGVLNLVFGVPSEVSTYLIPQSAVRLVTFTGSIPVGKHLSAMAGQHMKPAIMELGGHAPVIVCDDADPEASAATSALGKSRNSGQVCISPTRTEARDIMQKLGYGPEKPLVTKIATRNFPAWRDPAVILASQLKEIYIDAELEFVDTAVWYPKMARQDFTVGAVPIESGVDDPDQMFYENFYTGAQRNYAGYSDTDFDKLVDQQSAEPDLKTRKEIVWQIERKLAAAMFRPVLFYPAGASCWQPWVKGYTMMTNSIYNGWRVEDVWLDR